MAVGNSYRTILRSSSILGAASVVNVLSGLIRMKIAASLLGPVGVGLIGFFQNLIAMASTLSSVGLGNVGTRQVAEASAKELARELTEVRRALFWGTLILSVIGGIVFFTLRHGIAEELLKEPLRGAEIGWLALGVVLTVAAGSQTALLNGLRRVGDLARLKIISGILSTLIGVTVLYLWQKDGIVFFVIGAPLCSFVLGHWYVRKLERLPGLRSSAPVLAKHLKNMLALGLSFMLAGLVTTGGHLLVRSLVQAELGSTALGHFQAAWIISLTYLGVILSAMTSDYYPRLTRSIDDHKAATQLVNEQTEVVLLLVGPVLIGMLALAPWIIKVLYTDEFSDSVEILRWQTLGDLLKVISTALSYVLISSGAGKAYFFGHLILMIVLAAAVWVGIPLIGISATGICFIVAYLWYLPFAYWYARRRINFRWTYQVKVQAIVIALIALVILGVSRYSDGIAAIFGVLSAMMLLGYGFGRLATKAGVGGRLGYFLLRASSFVASLRAHAFTKKL